MIYSLTRPELRASKRPEATERFTCFESLDFIESLMFLRNQTFAVDFPTCLDNEEVTLKSFQEKSDFLLRLSSIDHLTIA